MSAREKTDLTALSAVRPTWWFTNFWLITPASDIPINGAKTRFMKESTKDLLRATGRELDAIAAVTKSDKILEESMTISIIMLSKALSCLIKLLCSDCKSFEKFSLSAKSELTWENVAGHVIDLVSLFIVVYRRWRFIFKHGVILKTLEMPSRD